MNKNKTFCLDLTMLFNQLKSQGEVPVLFEHPILYSIHNETHSLSTSDKRKAQSARYLVTKDVMFSGEYTQSRFKSFYEENGQSCKTITIVLATGSKLRPKACRSVIFFQSTV
mmetsp:Transcript_11497/g.31813  ORF Transcript_11497/g.31813 Transcript_11497/m.31813 type:complete len:113 (-) Transcript_11497:53-391(-)